MSYAFDVAYRAYEERIRPHIPDPELAMLFDEFLQELHSANHKVPSADGVFKGDGLNKDPCVSRAARELDEYCKSHPLEKT